MQVVNVVNAEDIRNEMPLLLTCGAGHMELSDAIHVNMVANAWRDNKHRNTALLAPFFLAPFGVGNLELAECLRE